MYFLPIIGVVVAGAAGVVAYMQWKRQQRTALSDIGLAPSGPSKLGPGAVFDTRVQEGGKAHHIVDLGRFGRGLIRNRVTQAGNVTPHWGVDITAPTLTPVRAALNGVVTDSRQIEGYGEAIAITHPQVGQSTVYAHLSRRLVDVGDEVTGGELIGLVGNTCSVDGREVPCWCRTQRIPRCQRPDGSYNTKTMGSHLHFEVHPAPHPTFSSTYERLDPVRWLQSHHIELFAWQWPQRTDIQDFGDL